MKNIYERVANLLVTYSLRVVQGDKLLIKAALAARPLVQAVIAEAYRKGALVDCLIDMQEKTELMYRYASDETLATPSPVENFAVGAYDCFLMITADENIFALTEVPPKRQIAYLNGSLSAFQGALSRVAKGELRMSVLSYPTVGGAQFAGMGTLEFEEMLLESIAPDGVDEVAYWRDAAAKQQKLIDRLSGANRVRIVAEGTDLTLSVAGRRWINCDCTFNVPDGEVYTGPVEDSAEGTIYFPYRHLYKGHEIDGVRLRFHNGEVIEASAQKGEDILLATLAEYPTARILGEFAVGTNRVIPRTIGNIFVDEKVYGTVHLALGNGYAQTGSTNKCPIHWDMVLDLRKGGTVEIDGETVLKDGNLLIWNTEE